MQPADLKTFNDFFRLDPEELPEFMAAFKDHIDATRPSGVISPQGAGGEYPLAAVEDFYAIPPDKLQACLADITPVLESLCSARQVATRMGVEAAHTFIQSVEMVWKDDDIRESVMNIQFETGVSPTLH